MPATTEAYIMEFENFHKFTGTFEMEQDYQKYLCNSSLVNVEPIKAVTNSDSLCVAKPKGASCIAQEIAKARKNIDNTLQGSRATATSGDVVANDKRVLELENEVNELRHIVDQLVKRVTCLEVRECTAVGEDTTIVEATATIAEVKKAKESDDECDLFASDSEEEAEAERIRKERLDDYHAKKAAKPALIAKSTIILDVKPWDDETDLEEMEKCVRSIVTPGLLWGASKFVPLAYGIRKLQITCVVEDDKVGTDFLEEEITKFEKYVQSVDIAAFQKI